MTSVFVWGAVVLFPVLLIGFAYLIHIFLNNFKSDEHYRYAGFWNRIFAGFLDYCVLSIVVGFLAVLIALAFVIISFFTISTKFDIYALLPNTLLICWVVVPIFYFAYWESSSKRATIGKQIMCIEVISVNGENITFFHSILRLILGFISFGLMGLGVLFIVATPKKQGIHDLLMKTNVVYIKK